MNQTTRTGPWPRMRLKVMLPCQLVLTLRLAMIARHGPLLVPALRVSQSRMLKVTQKDPQTPAAIPAPTWTLNLMLKLMTTHWLRLAPSHRPNSGGSGRRELQLRRLPQLEPLKPEQLRHVKPPRPGRQQLLPRQEMRELSRSLVQEPHKQHAIRRTRPSRGPPLWLDRELPPLRRLLWRGREKHRLLQEQGHSLLRRPQSRNVETWPCLRRSERKLPRERLP